MTPSRLKLISSIVFSIICTSSNGATLDNIGNPEQKPLTLKTYGVDVAARTGLKAILPTGWMLLIHKDVSLPDTVTWKLGDTWVKAIAEIAATNNIAVLIDWDKRQVRFREESIAIDERERRVEATNAAITPLPKFNEPTKQKFDLNTKSSPSSKMASIYNLEQQDRAKTLSSLESASSDAISRVPVIRTNPTEKMVRATQGVNRKYSSPVGDDTFKYTSPTSFNKPSARAIAQAIADRYNLRLVWQGREIELKGPVTLLGESKDEDLFLLEKAIGYGSPISFAISEKEIVVIQATTKTRQQLTFNPPERFSTLSIEPIPLASELPKVPPLKSHNINTAVTLEFSKGDSLENVLISFLKLHGYSVEWKVSGIFEAGSNKRLEAASIPSLLSQLLPTLGLSADIFTKDKHVVIRLAG